MTDLSTIRGEVEALPGLTAPDSGHIDRAAVLAIIDKHSPKPAEPRECVHNLTEPKTVFDTSPLGTAHVTARHCRGCGRTEVLGVGQTVHTAPAPPPAFKPRSRPGRG